MGYAYDDMMRGFPTIRTVYCVTCGLPNDVRKHPPVARLIDAAAAKDAEIARLRAELADVTRERDASRLISEGLHASNVKLRAALDKEREAHRHG